MTSLFPRLTSSAIITASVDFISSAKVGATGVQNGHRFVVLAARPVDENAKAANTAKLKKRLMIFTKIGRSRMCKLSRFLPALVTTKKDYLPRF